MGGGKHEKMRTFGDKIRDMNIIYIMKTNDK